MLIKDESILLNNLKSIFSTEDASDEILLELLNDTPRIKIMRKYQLEIWTKYTKNW